MEFKIDYVRGQFPSLSSDWVFFDNAGGSQILKKVTDKITDYLLNTNVQHGASYQVSENATSRVRIAADQMAELINAQDRSEIIMGSSSTQLLYTLAKSFGKTLKIGDEIIVTNCDHETNIGPWMTLEEQGIKIVKWELNPETLDLHIEDLLKLMTEKTKLVAFTHASNILGTINPVKEIVAQIHKHGAKACIDGVAYAPHRMVDVQDLGVDFYVYSFYKVYGPHYSMLYGKKDLLLEMPGLNHFFITNEEIPYKFQPGNVNFELSYGNTGVCDYFREFAQIHGQSPSLTLKESAACAFDYFASHEEKLAQKMFDFLNTRQNIKIIGKPFADKEHRVPTISFVVKNQNSDSIVQQIDPFKIGIRYGDFYARRLIEDLGLAKQNGVIRVSMVHYNTVEEVNKLISIFDRVL